MNNFSTQYYVLLLVCITSFSFGRIITVQKQLQQISVKIDSLQTQLNTPQIDTLYQVQATCYHAVAEQCDADYLCTASGLTINSTNTAYDHRYLAVSRDLLNTFPYGTEVIVSGTKIYDGVWRVADTMNKRFTNRIDFLVNPNMFVHKWNKVYLKKV